MTELEKQRLLGYVNEQEGLRDYSRTIGETVEALMAAGDVFFPATKVTYAQPLALGRIDPRLFPQCSPGETCFTGTVVNVEEIGMCIKVDHHCVCLVHLLHDDNLPAFYGAGRRVRGVMNAGRRSLIIEPCR
jgi:hypothetical protein